jgi:hypothetical protein
MSRSEREQAVEAVKQIFRNAIPTRLTEEDREEIRRQEAEERRAWARDMWDRHRETIRAELIAEGHNESLVDVLLEQEDKLYQ